MIQEPGIPCHVETRRWPSGSPGLLPRRLTNHSTERPLCLNERLPPMLPGFSARTPPQHWSCLTLICWVVLSILPQTFTEYEEGSGLGAVKHVELRGCPSLKDYRTRKLRGAQRGTWEPKFGSVTPWLCDLGSFLRQSSFQFFICKMEGLGDGHVGR